MFFKGITSFTLLSGFAWSGLAGVPEHPPTILTQPQSRTVSPTSSATLSVEVNGTPPFTYEWRQNGTPLPAGNRSSLTLQGIYAIGDYDVVVGNAFGAVTSAVARFMTSTAGPNINQELAGQNACVGDSVRLYVTPGGQGPFDFVWRWNGMELLWNRSSSLLLTNVTATNAGDYSVVVYNSFGTVTSAVVRLPVDPPVPIITRPPPSTLAGVGYDLTLPVSIFSCRPQAIQWRVNGTNIPGATGSRLSFTPLALDHTGDYDVVVSSAGGAVTSALATLVVTQTPPIILNGLASQTVYAGEYVYFDLSVVAAPPPTYYWHFNGQPWFTTNTASLRFTTLSTNQSGQYFVVVSNALGVATSTVATVTVLISPPRFNIQPVSVGAGVGSTAQLYGYAAGNPPPGYQWMFNGLPLWGATSNWLLLSVTALNQAGEYSLLATNESGSATSAVARLEVSLPGPLDRWEWRRPLPQGNDLYSVAYGNGTFVAVGREGARVVSSDGGRTWRNCNQGLPDTQLVAYGNGRFVALASGSTPAGNLAVWTQTSSNGLEWVEHAQPGLDAYFEDLTFGAGRFVTVSSWGRVAVSANGVEWQVATNDAGHGFSKVTYADGCFVALDYAQEYTNGLWLRMIAVSADGLVWTNRSLGLPGNLYDIAWADGRYVIAGRQVISGSEGAAAMFTSTDGFTWTVHPLPFTNYLMAVASGGGRFVAASEYPGGLVVTSPDGTTWTPHCLTPSNELYEVAWGGDRFVAVGNFGNLFTSPDGATWTAASAATTENLRGVVQGASLSVAVGNEGLVLTSSNGVAWTSQPRPTTNNLRGITYTNGLFVAVGDGDIVTSSNGLHWTRRFESSLYDVTCGRGLFVAVGEAGAASLSRDGSSWTEVLTGAGDRLNSVSWGNGLFVAVGRQGRIVTSPNGTNWVSRTSGTPLFLQGIAYGNGTWVAVGQGGALVTSSNGVLWTVQPTPYVWQYRDFEDVWFDEGRFILAGENGVLGTSPDGALWTPRLTRCRNDLRGVIYADGRLLAVGNNDTILQSGYFGPARLRVRLPFGPEGFEFSVEGESGRAHRLQASDDLKTWEDVFDFSNTQETTLFLDTDAALHPLRFYRVVSP